ncbi:hypothetical protein BC643_2163 [Mangrovibacterium diazotrophicum]|uniref:Uncharacterized protein n=1 Tax=Mangrovibacterium diazotrophicum TaxID=1261403 RepID=A0A419W8J7_9BACT|nr:hypothetical protein BC643_2163 [Mangrovibacterium diazotrophicum]
MKKQFLNLGLFLLAIVAGISESNAQAVHWSTSQTLSCTTDALHPAPGVKYTYTADVTNDPTISTSTPNGQWRFWATTDTNFLVDNSGTPQFNYATALTVGTNKILTASSDYNIEIGTSGANTDGNIDLSWTSGLLNSVIDGTVEHLFVVAYYENAAGCTDNIHVWELDPKNSFIVDIIAMDAAALASSKDKYNVTPSTCVDNVESLKYENGGLVYDYGDNYLYFEFIAANFTDYWIPVFSLEGLASKQTATYEYTFATPDAWGASTVWNTLTSGSTQIAPAGTYTDGGVSIFVRVKVDHNSYENLSGQTLTMYLDGKLGDGTFDTVNSTCDDPLGADQADSAKSTIDPRPENDDSTMPSPNFLGGNTTNI